MFARMITMYARPGYLREAVDVTRTVILPSMQTYAGFNHWYTLVDWDSEKVVSIAFWTSAADMDTYCQLDLPKLMGKIGEVMRIDTSELDTLDVAIYTRAEIAAV